MTDPLARLEQQLAEATPRPWHVGGAWNEDDQAYTRPIVLEPLGSIGADELPASMEDAVLIVAAVNALPHLIAVARAADEAMAMAVDHQHVGKSSLGCRVCDAVELIALALAGLRAALGEPA